MMTARRNGGMVRVNITACMETKLTKLEDKGTLTETEEQTVSKVVKKMEAFAKGFKHTTAPL